MFDPRPEKLQSPLPFYCASCIQKALGRCSGPVNAKAYNMRGDALITCSDVERRETFFADLYSRVVPKPERSFHEMIDWAPFIPGIDEGLDCTLELPANTVVAISLQTFLTNTGALRFASAADLRERLKIPSHLRLALVNTAKDQKLERFWGQSDRSDLLKKIADFGFYFVTSPTFSIYDENPRADHIFNQDRNLITNDSLTNLGVPAVPFLYPFNQDDYEDAFEWIRERRDLTKIAVLGQFYKSPRQFRQFLHNMRLIRDGVDRPLEFLVVGVAKRERIEAIMSEFDASIVSWKPFDCAVYGGIGITSKLECVSKRARENLQRVEIAKDNIDKFITACEKLYRSQRRLFIDNAQGPQDLRPHTSTS